MDCRTHFICDADYHNMNAYNIYFPIYTHCFWSVLMIFWTQIVYRILFKTLVINSNRKVKVLKHLRVLRSFKFLVLSNKTNKQTNKQTRKISSQKTFYIPRQIIIINRNMNSHKSYHISYSLIITLTFISS